MIDFTEGEFTPAEIDATLALYKRAIVRLATAQSYTEGDVTFTRSTLPQIQKTYDWLVEQKSQGRGNSRTIAVITEAMEP